MKQCSFVTAFIPRSPPGAPWSPLRSPQPGHSLTPFQSPLLLPHLQSLEVTDKLRVVSQSLTTPWHFPPADLPPYVRPLLLVGMLQPGRSPPGAGKPSGSAPLPPSDDGCGVDSCHQEERNPVMSICLYHLLQSDNKCAILYIEPSAWQIFGIWHKKNITKGVNHTTSENWCGTELVQNMEPNRATTPDPKTCSGAPNPHMTITICCASDLYFWFDFITKLSGIP